MRNSNLNAIEDVPRLVMASANRHVKAKIVGRHRHGRSELVFNAGGQLIIETETRSWAVPGECGIYIAGNVEHTINIAGPAHLYVAWIDAGESVRGMDGCEVVSVSALLRSLLIEMTDIPVLYDEQGRDGMLVQLFVEELRRAESIPIGVPLPRHADLLAECRRFMKSPRIDETADMWSETLGLSTRTFDRVFIRETGMSFGNWRRQAGLANALLRLARGDSVTAVSLDLGYETVSAFSTMVRKQTGAPPSRWQTKGSHVKRAA